jgi:hypothetical protein
VSHKEGKQSESHVENRADAAKEPTTRINNVGPEDGDSMCPRNVGQLLPYVPEDSILFLFIVICLMMLHAGFLLRLFFDPESRGDIFLRNVG